MPDIDPEAGFLLLKGWVPRLVRQRDSSMSRARRRGGRGRFEDQMKGEPFTNIPHLGVVTRCRAALLDPGVGGHATILSARFF